MTWDEIFTSAIDSESKITVKHYGDGMFTVTVGILSESDLTEDEAKQWAHDHL